MTLTSPPAPDQVPDAPAPKRKISAGTTTAATAPSPLEQLPVEDGEPPVSVGFEVQDLLSHLLRRGHFQAEAEFSDAYAGLDVTSRQLALLFAINRSPGSTQTELADAIGFDLNTFSDLTKRSERKGWVQRLRCKGDRRAYRLYLTSSGREMVATAAELTPAYQQRLTRGRLSQAEAAQLVHLLRKMLGLDEN